MKRFLMIICVTIVTVSLGLTVYTFVKDDETFAINSTQRYINVGQALSLDDLGYVHSRPTNKVTVDFNAGGDQVTSLIEFDPDSQSYVAKEGGRTTIVITTTHDKYARLEVEVIIGNGTSEYPYFIKSQRDIQQYMYSQSNLSCHYQLMNNITLTGEFVPIGLIARGAGYDDYGFSGTFNGMFYSIDGLNVAVAGIKNAGLFSQVNPSGVVKNVTIKNGRISGDFDYAGIIAGTSNGQIDAVTVDNSVVSNTKIANSGLAVGRLASTTSVAKLTRVSTSGIISAKGYVGGVIGVVDGATVDTVLTTANILADSYANNVIGGLVGGYTTADTKNSSIRQSLAMAKITASGDAGTLIGNVTGTVNTYTLMGLYYRSDEPTTVSLGAVGATENTITAPFAVNGALAENLRKKETYKYYQLENGDIEPWNTKTCWYFANNAYPGIMQVNEAITPISAEIVTSGKTIMTAQSSSDVLDHLDNADENTRIVLKNDVDLNGAEWSVISEFAGELTADKKSDGTPYAIKNIKISTADTNLGLFGLLTGAYVHDIVIDGVDISAVGTNVGALAGKAILGTIIDNVTIKNVTIVSENTNNLYNVGGIVGKICDSTTITDCVVDTVNISNTTNSCVSGHKYGGAVGSAVSSIIDGIVVLNGDISGQHYVGGVLGESVDTILSDVNADVVSPEDSNYSAYINNNVRGKSLQKDYKYQTLYIGGIVGMNNGTVKNAHSFASIYLSSDINRNMYVGGVVGCNHGIISYSAYRDTVDSVKVDGSKGNLSLGGIAGVSLEYTSKDNVYIDNCYNNCSFEFALDSKSDLTCNTYVGGLVGKNSASVSNSYSIGNIKAYNVGGLVCVNIGTVYRCYVSGDAPTSENAYNPDTLSQNELTGQNVGGLVCSMTKGEIYACYVSSILEGISNSWLSGSKNGGLVASLPGNNTTYGIISDCVSACTFGSSAKNYIVGQVDLMGRKLSSDRFTGQVINCYLDSEMATKHGAKVGMQKKVSILTLGLSPTSKSEFYRKNTFEMKGILDKLSSAWELTIASEYPSIKFTVNP